MTLTGGKAEGTGGAVLLQGGAELVVNNSTFSENTLDSVDIGGNRFTGGFGSAIGTERFSGSISVRDSEFRGNEAEFGGGAIYLNGGTANISGSAFISNRGPLHGGAIVVDTGWMNIENSTFRRNRSSNGGAISISRGSLTMTHLTMVANSSSYGGGAAIRQWDGSAVLRNSIVAGSSDVADCHGNVSGSGNFSEDGTCGATEAGDPQLDEMTGAPGYFTPLEGSPVVDAADAAYCLATDQTGKPRPQGAGCDIGAIEFGEAAPAEPTPETSECTLANHILSANTNTSVGGCPAGTSHDIITLTENIRLSAPLPAITGTITIEGNGHTISGDRTHRIFTVSSRKLTINDLTLTRGKAEGNGGAILVQGGAELVVNNSQFLRNVAVDYERARNRYGGGGGAIGTENFSGRISINNSAFDTNDAHIRGGALNITGGTTDISGTTFTVNQGRGFGGAINVEGGKVNIQNSSFSRNRSQHGGGIAVNGGTVTLTHLTMFANRSTFSEGASIWQRRGSVSLRNSIVSGSSTHPDCDGNVSLRSNFSEDGTCGATKAGDPQLDEMSDMPGYLPPLENSPVVDAADAAYCLETDQTGKPRPQGAGCDIGAIEVGFVAPAEATPEPTECTLADYILSANSNTSVGGCPAGTSDGIITLTQDITLSEPLPEITGTITIEGNGHTISGDDRFRIFQVAGGKLTINNLRLTRAYVEGVGGAIFLRNNAELVVNDSTFEGNRVDYLQDGDSLFIGYGGAIGTTWFSGRLSVNNSEFTNNHGHSGGAIGLNGGSAEIRGSAFVDNEADGAGGAIDISGVPGSQVSIQNSTFSGNVSGNGAIAIRGATVTMTHLTMLNNTPSLADGSAIHVFSGATAQLRNSIVASGGNRLDCHGDVDVSRGNFSRDGSCALWTGGDPKLGELRGAPSYFPLMNGSPALDAADAEFCLETDQIGTARPHGGGCDIGAFESTTATAPEPTPVPSACTLANHIISANTNTSVGGCPAGTSHDIITLTEDITLSAPLPEITGTITIEGNGHTISGDRTHRIFTVSSRKLTINDLTLTMGKAEGYGGAILVQGGAELVINNSQFLRNVAGYYEDARNRHGGRGGAIGTQGFSGRISISKSVFDANRAEIGAGALYLDGGTTDISGSTFTSNDGKGFGGAIEVEGGRVNTQNSTFSLNRAANGRVVSVNRGTVTLTHLTIFGYASYDGGGAIYQRRGTVSLRNSIVAGGGDKPDCRGNVNVSGNFSQDGACGAAEAGDPQLDAMTGTPGYLPPLEGSPVVDAADAAYCLATDQTGKPRPQGAGCDIGAIEVGDAGPAAEEPAAEEPVAEEPVAEEAAGPACSVTTTDVLNFRDGPNGSWIGIVPANASFTALGFDSGWYNVEQGGVAGWISGDYVTTSGNCA